MYDDANRLARIRLRCRSREGRQPGSTGVSQACAAAHRDVHHNTEVTIDLGDPPRGIAAASQLFGKIPSITNKAVAVSLRQWLRKRLRSVRLPLRRPLDDRPADARFVGAKVAQPPGPVLGDERERIAVS